MEYTEKLKKLLCKELDEYAMKTKMSAGDLDVVHKLTDTVKNLDKIEMLEEESGGYSGARRGRRGGYSRDDGRWEAMGTYDDTDYSEARGRRGNVRRDNMGRYSRDSSYSYDEYSRDGAKEMMVEQIEEMLENAENPKEREALRRCMTTLKNA